MEPDPTTTHARSDADETRAKGADEAKALLARVRAAVDGLLVQVATLEREVDEAQRALATEREPEEPRRAAQAEREPADAKRPGGAEPDPADPKRAGGTEREPAEPSPPGTGLVDADLDAAVAQLEQAPPGRPRAGDPSAAEPDAPAGSHDALPTGARADEASPAERDDGKGEDGAREGRGVERARLVALNMALDGDPRDRVEEHLRDELEISEPGEILDEVYDRAQVPE